MSGFIADRVYNYSILTGDERPEKPGLVAFKNSDKAIEMLNRHIKGDEVIAVHCDVDMDGVGSGYIACSFLRTQGVMGRTGFMINPNKEHGVNEKHSEYTVNNDVGLMIILDSSTNELECIKQMNCDVLVIDHHEILHNELCGNTVGGEYVIVSNMVDNMDCSGLREAIAQNGSLSYMEIEEYKADENMSGGLVLYEFLRMYEEVTGIRPVVEDLRLYQWAAVTLVSDVISLNNARNQWYIQNTILGSEIETCLQTMMEKINKWNPKIDKSTLQFSLMPLIGAAIRCGYTDIALDTIINRPGEIDKLKEYRDRQNEIINGETGELQVGTNYAMSALKSNEHKSYSGLIATRIRSAYDKNAATFIVEDGVAKGSFRGRITGVDYRRAFKDGREDIYAQGHGSSFGFKIQENLLGEAMERAAGAENGRYSRDYVTLGDMSENRMGEYHIEDVVKFKSKGLLWRLAIANSRLSSTESINIVVRNKGYKPEKEMGKVLMYQIEGLECIAFEVLRTEMISIYAEYGNEGIKMYARNK